MTERIKELVTATDAWCDQNFPPDWTERVDEFLPLWNEKFAALVAAAEREACARVCDPYTHGQWFAKAIRARGSK
jgi:hypothetical protein